MNQGIHTVDLLLWLLGPVARVTGRTATRLHTIEVEDTAVAMLEFANGAIGTIEATTAAFPGFPAPARDHRDEGQRSSTRIRRGPPSSPTPRRTGACSRISSTPSRSGRPPACDGREGRRSVALVEAIYRSVTIWTERGATNMNKLQMTLAAAASWLPAPAIHAVAAQDTRLPGGYVIETDARSRRTSPARTTAAADRRLLVLQQGAEPEAGLPQARVQARLGRRTARRKRKTRSTTSSAAAAR